MAAPGPAATATWQADLGAALASAGTEIAAWVPDKRLAPVSAALAAGNVPLRTLTREEECVGYAAGFRAAGRMPVVLMQCSGLGNAMNAFGSLAVPYGLAFPVVISMRGSLGERNMVQVPMGRAAVDMLALVGIQAFPLHRREDIGALVRGVFDLARDARQVAAIMLEPELDF